MTPRAVIFDIYGTLLEVGPPPPDADERWRQLFLEHLGSEPRLGRLEFSVISSRVIAREHEAARARSIPWPEVHWPSVVEEILPELGRLPRHARDDFLFRQAQTGRTTHLTAGAAATVRALKQRGVGLGLASNAQAYTGSELQEALVAHDLDPSWFERDLCFWSFAHGFSKPDPHVFRILTARLADRGITAGETLMVGDDAGRDLEPARAQGWRTWQLRNTEAAGEGGDWGALRRRLELPH